jgi:aminodeoxyfutalosine synthase
LKLSVVMFDYRFYQNLDLGDIYRKVQAGRRLDPEDGLKLFSCQDIVAIGALAHEVRTLLHGNVAYYVMNQHINYSNICVNGCRFCAFGKQQGDPLAFELSLPAILEKVKARRHAPLTEVHIVGGCHPQLRLAYFESVLREIKGQCPSVIIKAFTAVEIDHFAKKEGMTSRDVLIRLKAAGLDMLPGGGAEIFSPRVRSMLCPDKTTGEKWLKIVREAHQLGIKTNATMLYGHIETPEERLEHLVALRTLQDETGGFVCFIPLPFQTANNSLTGIDPTTGIADLKTIAISRLMLDNIPHVKAYWIMLTVKLAQIALFFGADDFDGTVIEEKIGHMAGAQSEQALTRSELERIIREGGFEPVERNSFFERVNGA